MGSSPQSLRSPSPFPAFAYSRTKRHLLFFGGARGSSSGGGSAGVAVRWAVFECADALRRGREKWRTSDSPAALVEARSPTVLLPLHCHALRRRWTAVFYETRGSFDPKVFGKRQYPPRSPIRFVIVPPFLTALIVRAPLGIALAAIVPRAVEDAHIPATGGEHASKTATVPYFIIGHT